MFELMEHFSLVQVLSPRPVLTDQTRLRLIPNALSKPLLIRWNAFSLSSFSDHIDYSNYCLITSPTNPTRSYHSEFFQAVDSAESNETMVLEHYRVAVFELTRQNIMLKRQLAAAEARLAQEDSVTK